VKALVKSREERGLWLEDVPEPEMGINDVKIRVLATGICGTDLHIYDWDAWARSTIRKGLTIGHEFVGEVVGHGPDYSGDFPVGSRVTSMPILIRAGREPHVIGHDPDAPGAFGELMVVSEVMTRKVPDDVPNDVVAVVDAFAVGEFYVRCSGIGPG